LTGPFKNIIQVNSLKASIKDLNHLLGNIDIYLLDQVLKGRFSKKFKILDAGCGEGRNLIYFVRNGYRVYGIDKNADAIAMLKYLVKSINKDYPPGRFTAGDIGALPYKNNEFDAIISSAVLHFAENETHFKALVTESSRVLKSGGILFARIATIIGMEDQAKSLGSGKYLLPDGSVRFLLTRELLEYVTEYLGFEYVEPFKIVLVDGKRCMSTLVLKKT